MSMRTALCVVMMGLATVAASAQPMARVLVDEARLETVEQWREVTGSLRALQRSVLASEEEGLVVELTRREGDAVKAGEVLARLDESRARLDVARATAAVGAKRAALEVLRSEAEWAARDLSRVEDLYQRGSANESELDQRRTAARSAAARVEEAEAQLAQAVAELELAQERLADMTVEAPFAGRVVVRRTEVGQWVQRGDPIAEVVALDAVEAWLDVPERLIERLSRPEARVQIRVGALAETIEAPVTAIVPVADPLSRLFPVRVRLENAGERLRPGMSVVGLVPAGTSGQTLTISKDAIRRDAAGEFVFFDAGGVAAVARIETLFAIGPRRVAIRAGTIQPGMRVVVEGNERLFPGTPILAVDASEARSPGGAGAGGGRPGEGR